MSDPVTTQTLLKKKRDGEKITAITAYDYSMARMIDAAGVDIVLVGDSLGMVVLGHNTTIPVTMEDMLHHCKAVVRGVERAMVVGDMPFMSFQISPSEAVKNAGRFLQEAGVHAVKLEGGAPVIEAVRRIVDVGIPVMGHLGFTPQSVHQFGGPRIQGKDKASGERILDDAKLLEEAGAFAIVLELVPKDLAGQITESVRVPTIGIGSGPHCDGQVQVSHDMLGLYSEFHPRHAKRFADLSPQIIAAFKSYIEEVKAGKFPGPEHSV